MKRARYLILVAVLALLIATAVALAASQYNMEESVVSSGGGEHSSASYHLTDVVGEAVVGTSESSNFILRSGFLPFVPAQAQSLDIPLKAGWNMVSVPVIPTDNTVSAVFPDVAAVYTWNPDTKSYVTPIVVEPEKGYWVAVTAGKTISVTGVPVTTWTINDIKAGWNMIGSVTDNADFTAPNDYLDLSVQPFAYWWDSVAKTYIMTTTIEPGKGYWVASVNACSLTLP